MNNYKFEEMTENYLQNVLDIYNYYVEYSSATFHIKPLTLDEMREIVFFGNPVYKTYLIKNESNSKSENENESKSKNDILGYVLLTQHKKREAYNGTAEVTIYLKPDSIGKGIGNIAVKYIEKYARTKGLHVLIASICGDNQKSIKLFEKNGYKKCAHYKEVGKKFDKFLDVVAYQKML